MARRRRRRGFGWAKEEHRRRAARMGISLKLERKVVLGHLTRRECAAALRGLAMTGYAAGKYAAEREAAGRWVGPRGGRGRAEMIRPIPGRVSSKRVMGLADKVARICLK